MLYLIKNFYFTIFFPKLSEAISSNAPNTAPITNANRYISGLLTALARIAKIPP